jgi:hypothetical protein
MIRGLGVVRFNKTDHKAARGPPWVLTEWALGEPVPHCPFSETLPAKLWGRPTIRSGNRSPLSFFALGQNFISLLNKAASLKLVAAKATKFSSSAIRSFCWAGYRSDRLVWVKASVNGQQGGPADHQAGLPPSERAGPSWPRGLWNSRLTNAPPNSLEEGCLRSRGSTTHPLPLNSSGGVNLTMRIDYRQRIVEKELPFARSTARRHRSPRCRALNRGSSRTTLPSLRRTRDPCRPREDSPPSR